MPNESPKRDKDVSLRNKIKSFAIRMFTLRGYRGVSFGDLTEELGTTRANIHYHFGSKSGLAEEALDAAAEGVIRKYETIWADKNLSINEKLHRSYAFNARRYARYNSDGESKIWSLIARFRIDRDVLTPSMIAKLNMVTRANEESVNAGVEIAITKGELKADTPKEEVSCLISGVIHFAPLISQAPHNLERLKKTYESLSHLIHEAYSTEKNFRENSDLIWKDDNLESGLNKDAHT